jgi:hypothetical protein
MESADCRCDRCAHGLIVSRRWFLGAAGALIVAPVAEPIVRHVFKAPLLPALPLGWSVSRDGVGLYTVSHPLSGAEFRRVMVNGLNEVFTQVYAEHELELELTFMSRKSLETIEIEVPSVFG